MATPLFPKVWQFAKALFSKPESDFVVGWAKSNPLVLAIFVPPADIK
jgi:hypothetical protein